MCAGQDEAEFPRHNCALPHPVAGIPENVVAIACGSGNQGCTAVVGESGTLFTFGSNFKARLGHNEASSQRYVSSVQDLDQACAIHLLHCVCNPSATLRVPSICYIACAIHLLCSANAL